MFRIYARMTMNKQMMLSSTYSISMQSEFLKNFWLKYVMVNFLPFYLHRNHCI